MKLNKITLAAVLTLGLMASTNVGFAQETATDMSNDILAACPLSGCSSPVINKSANCSKCHKEKKSCKPVQDDCNQCPPIAQCPTPSDPTCAVCPQPADGKKFMQQVYAYPNAIYGNNQIVGERNNAVFLGDGSNTTMQGIPVAEAPNLASNCGCDDGSMTGAAAPLPCLDNCQMINGIPVDRNPMNFDGSDCPMQIHTNTSLEATKKTIAPFDYSPITGGAAPIAHNIYPDVPYGYWASCDINTLTENDILAGYPNGTFKPSSNISRAEMATMVVKGFNLPSCNLDTNLFSDVSPSHWASRNIASAVENGIMAGYPNNTFKPNQPLSRAEAFSIIAQNIKCPMDECKADEILSKYSDGNSVPTWAKIPVAKVLDNNGITNFPQSGVINAHKDASRAEVASMMENVRVALGYSKDDKVSSLDCECSPKKAFYEKEEVVTIPTLQLTFSDEISAKSATVGDRFSAKTIDSITIDGMEFPAGSRVYGKVLEVVRPDAHCQGALKLSFDRIENGKCKAQLPNQILTAQVNKVKKPNPVARLIEFPFTWTGGLIGNAGRTVGGALISLSNAVEQTIGGVGVGTGEIFQGEFRAAGRSYVDVGKAIVKAPVDLTRTALSGTMGLFQYTGDEISYLVDPKGTKVSSVNPKEKVTIAFGCREQ
ncbi:S-layer homology domain-containing protein [bacterium]|nr:S-layer homology domain-containing protein [bacterium]